MHRDLKPHRPTKTGIDQQGMWRRGVVHRDLKPENFLLKAKHATVDHPCTQWNVRCIDFGSAAIVRPGAYPPPLSHAPASFPRLQ